MYVQCCGSGSGAVGSYALELPESGPFYQLGNFFLKSSKNLAFYCFLTKKAGSGRQWYGSKSGSVPKCHRSATQVGELQSSRINSSASACEGTLLHWFWLYFRKWKMLAWLQILNLKHICKSQFKFFVQFRLRLAWKLNSIKTQQNLSTVLDFNFVTGQRYIKLINNVLYLPYRSARVTYSFIVL